jgi:peroxin-11B
VLRLGKNIEHYKAAAVALDSKQLDPVLRYCAVGRQLGYGTYLSFDALTYLDAAGIKKNPSAKEFGKIAYRAWLFGIVCNLIAGSYTLYNLSLRDKAVNKKDGEGVVESKRIERYVSCCEPSNRYSERQATQLQLISDLCDFTVPTSALGLINFDDGFVGLTGTASSLLGVWGQWKKTA